MFFQHQAFWLPKDSSRVEEYQDAYDCNPEEGVAAIADGVSSSLFSGSWARILSKAIVAGPPDVSDDEVLTPWLEEFRKQWLEPIDEASLSWHQKPKFQKGAHTTLLWVEFYTDMDYAPGEADFYCYSIGDCCLFHVRDDKTIRSFPFTESSLFDNNPAVIGSSNKQFDDKIPIETFQGKCIEGDLIVLCTDAIAQYAIAESEQGNHIKWRQFWDMPQETWQEWVETHRKDAKMRYDDTTLMLLKMGKPPEESVEEAELTNGEDPEDDSAEA